MANYRARPSSLYEGQEVADQMGRAGIHGGSNMTNTNYATYSSQHLNHLAQQQVQQQQVQQQQLINNAFSSSNVNLQNLVQQQTLQNSRQPSNGHSPNVNSSPYVQQPYSTTDLHRFSQNADKYSSEVSANERFVTSQVFAVSKLAVDVLLICRL